MHPQLSVSAVSSWQQPLADDLTMWKRLGVDQVGLSLRKCEEVGLATAASAFAGLRVSNIVECGWLDLHDPHSWASTTDRWELAVSAFSEFAPWCLVLTTGAAFRLDWELAVARFGDATETLRAHARDNGVTIAVENTGSLRVDLSFVHTLRDAIGLAEDLDVRVCAELNSCWAERGVDELLGHDRIGHVQLSDFVVGSLTTPDRCVPGDGDVPLARLLDRLHRSDYHGAYEIEMVGPRIESEGYEPAIRRAIASADALLNR